MYADVGLLMVSTPDSAVCPMHAAPPSMVPATLSALVAVAAVMLMGPVAQQQVADDTHALLPVMSAHEPTMASRFACVLAVTVGSVTTADTCVASRSRPRPSNDSDRIAMRRREGGRGSDGGEEGEEGEHQRQTQASQCSAGPEWNDGTHARERPAASTAREHTHCCSSSPATDTAHPERRILPTTNTYSIDECAGYCRREWKDGVGAGRFGWMLHLDALTVSVPREESGYTRAPLCCCTVVLLQRGAERGACGPVVCPAWCMVSARLARAEVELQLRR